jgi:NADH dehydrogenase
MRPRLILSKPQKSAVTHTTHAAGGGSVLNVFAKLQRVLPFMPLACADARFQPVWVGDVVSAVLHSLARNTTPAIDAPRIIELCGSGVFALRELVQLSARLSGIREGRGRPVLALPRWLGRLQAMLMELSPGEPLMNRDNLDSMRVDNVASGPCATLQSLGITPAALRPIAAEYLKRR